MAGFQAIFTGRFCVITEGLSSLSKTPETVTAATCSGKLYIMWIMIAGPYSSGARTAGERAKNLRAMNRVALEVHRRGHVPIIGVNLALPLIEVAGEAMFDDLMMPLSLALAERCDAVLRVGGPSTGADLEVECIRARGGAVYASIEELPEL